MATFKGNCPLFTEIWDVFPSNYKCKLKCEFNAQINRSGKKIKK